MSILDTDLYKLTMQQAVLELYPNAYAGYKFINRRPSDKFTPDIVKNIKHNVELMGDLSLKEEEKNWLRHYCPYFKKSYLEYLSNYRYDPQEVFIAEKDGDLEVGIRGPWHRTILWEVPLLSIISEAFFENIPSDYGEQETKAKTKAKVLAMIDCKFADFGTRRRRDYRTQEIFISNAKKEADKFFVGTSNVHFAKKYNVKPIGTMAHEWVMGVSALCSLRHANRYALENWLKVYGADLGIALTDTFGSQAFFKDFNLNLTKIYDGVRQDSGNPFDFAEQAIAHYEQLKIDPLSKTIVFSDGLDVKNAVKIRKYCNNRIGCSFGIGTHFTNDYPEKALNIVIKLTKMNQIPVVKLSDDRGKEIGDADALKVAKWMFFGLPL